LPAPRLAEADRERLWRGIQAGIERKGAWRLPAILRGLRGLVRRRPVVAWAPTLAAAVFLVLTFLQHTQKKESAYRAELGGRAVVESVEVAPSTSVLLIETAKGIPVIWVMEPRRPEGSFLWFDTPWFLLTSTCLALVIAPRASAQPTTVTFSGQIIEASNPASPDLPDPAIPAGLLGELKSTFQFTKYKALGTVTGSTSVGKTWSTPLANTGLTLEVLPTASGGGTVTAVVRLLRGGAAAMTSTLRIATGGQVLTGGLRFPPVVSSSSSAPGRLLFV
jgi:hypothetical protein